MKSVIVTGGCGYIGSHIVLQLLKEFNVIVIDNNTNSSPKVLKVIEKITKRSICFIKADIRNKISYEYVFEIFKPVAVIHLAGLKAVGDSVKFPLEYYDNNVSGTIRLLEVMKKYGCNKIVFSSSATVYRPSDKALNENSPLGPTNPYGRTKLMIEDILKDLRGWQVVTLRYFNPIGADQSGLIGEDPKGTPNNLLPYITQVMVDRRKYLNVFGDDYKTVDGTGVRDYIHVCDLADGHVVTLKKILDIDKPYHKVYNLGTGKGYSVKQVVNTMEKVSGIKVPLQITGRRPGDVAICFSSPDKISEELGWKTRYNLEDMCRDSWRWQKGNPDGF